MVAAWKPLALDVVARRPEMGYSDAPQFSSMEAAMFTIARFLGSIRDI
jgi:hypothetical protein